MALMSNFPSSEPETVQARWYHLLKHHDINSFLPLYHTNCGLQEGQLYNLPSSDKNSDVVNLSPLSHPLKDKHRFDCEFERCGHTSTDYETLKNRCIVAQGDDITQLDTGLENGNTTFQSGVFGSEEQWTGLGQNAFQGSLHAPEPVSRYSDLPTRPVKHGEQQQIGDLLLMNNSAAVEFLVESNGDLQEQGNETFDNNVHGNTVAPKQKGPAIDKKEMRARRNRESARRSRMKSKQHFQRMEQTLVLMRRENRALLVLMEKLLPNYIARFPHLTGKLQSLFEMG